jgi:uncharacterized protein (TIGR03435 family)
MESTWFNIEAKVPAGATEDQFRMMARNLLAERFKLAVHFVKAEAVGYEMTVAPGGRKFKAAANISKRTESGGFGSGPGRAFIMSPCSMDQLASFLSDYLDWPVVDLTGLAGTYDINLRFGASTPWMQGPAGQALPQGPPPVEAVHDQLGPVLERTKTPVDVLIVDHVEKRPTA